MAASIRAGRLRDNSRGRGWRARLYAPTERYPYHRVKFKDPSSGAWVDRPVPPGEDPDEHFDKVEEALNSDVAQPASRAERPEMNDLAARYLKWLADQGCDSEYIYNREILLSVWVLRGSGDLLVQDWSPEHSQAWIGAIRAAGLSAQRVEDLGVALAGMRTTARRKDKSGTRWLSPTEDPMEGVKYSRRTTTEAGHRDYVLPAQRPTTAAALSLIDEAEADPAWDWMPTQLRVGIFCGLRLSEQFALRVVDVDLDRHVLHVRNSMGWPHPRRGVAWSIKATKTKRRREVPYPASMHDELLELCRRRLEMSTDATPEDVAAAQAALYEEHLRVLDDKLVKTSRARAITAHDRFLFPHVDGGPPPTKETYGDAWRDLRARSAWPDRIPWRNARHHAATWWRAVIVNEQGTQVDWDVIAVWLGNSLATCQAHYVIAGEDARETARRALEGL